MAAVARRASWEELLAHPAVMEHAVTGSAFGVMAYHGGLEAGTAEIARAVAAATGSSLYVVQQPAELRWHVPSRVVDPTASTLLGDWLGHVRVALSIHGYGRLRRPRSILLGGRNRGLAAHVARHLNASLEGFEPVTDLEAMPVELRGIHRANPVNRPPGAGVQVELPPSARDRTDARDQVVAGLAAAVLHWPLGV